MDIVYPVRPGQKNEELRYSLRSLGNLPHGRVWIVGYQLPDWLRNVGIIPSIPEPRSRYRDTEAKLVEALIYAEVSDPFLLFNDDFYVMKPLRSIKVQHMGPLADKIRKPASSYGKGITAALDQLKREGIEEPLSYELHTPFRIQKSKMLSVLEQRDGVDSYHYRTMYGNLHHIGGSYSEDVKVYRHTPFTEEQKQLPLLSTSDMTFRYHPAGTYIRSVFTEPSSMRLILWST